MYFDSLIQFTRGKFSVQSFYFSWYCPAQSCDEEMELKTEQKKWESLKNVPPIQKTQILKQYYQTILKIVHFQRLVGPSRFIFVKFKQFFIDSAVLKQESHE